MRWIAIPMLALLAACTSTTPVEQGIQGKITRAAAELCTLIKDHYIYFEDRSTHWSEACALAQTEALTARSSAERLAVLENLLDELYDAHASLGTNTSTSPRLIPSGADYWIVADGDCGRIVGVRPGSGAARARLHPGDRVKALNTVPLRQAAMTRIRTDRAHVPSKRLNWAMNAMAAGYRGKPRVVSVLRSGKQLELTLEDPVPKWPGEHVTARMLDGGIGYIRLNNSLGDAGTVKAFDAAVETLKSAKAWILDLRDTPGGGNTGVAEPIMGRFITEERPYQRIIPAEKPAYERRVSPRGPWTISGPLLVLVGHWTGSMGEGMAIGLDGMGRGRVMGSQMAGLAGGTEEFTLKQIGIRVHLPTYDLAHLDGTPRQNWLPPHRILADNGDGPDLALAEAQNWLRKHADR